MSADRRLARLEDRGDPVASVRRWLSDAHAAGSLPLHVDDVLERPLAAAPLVVVSERARVEARVTHRGMSLDQRLAAERRAVADATLLFLLVIELERRAHDLVTTGSLRVDALHWRMRALAAEDPADHGSGGWDGWATDLARLAGDLDQHDAMRRVLVDHYLEGTETLFPETLGALAMLRGTVDDLVTFASILRPEHHAVDIDAVRRGALGDPTAVATDVADMVRARTLDLLGDAPAATRIVAHRLRIARPTIDGDGPRQDLHDE